MRTISIGAVMAAVSGVLVSGALMMSGCREAQAPVATGADDEATTAWSRVVLQLPAGELPFVVSSQPAGDGQLLRLQLHNADAAIDIGAVSSVVGDGAAPVARTIEPYASVLEGTPAGAEASSSAFDQLLAAGTWTIERTDGSVTVPFRAQSIDGPGERFEPIADAGELAGFAGRWRVRFDGDDDDAVGVFEVDAETGLATGTFLTTTGDYGHLAGRADGDLLRLSTFDGAHAFLFHAEMQPDGTLSGTFWSGTWWEQAWTAQRDESVTIGDGFARTTATVVDFDTAEVGNLTFTTADRINSPALLSGLMPAGEPRLLYIFGTWCPNCTDAAAFIKELHATYAPRGLRVGAIAFERNLETAPQRVAAYAEHHGTPWGIVIGGLNDKAKASEALPFLDKVRSYPTAVFIHRDGTIEDVYSGFSGPATGEAYSELRAQWIERVEAILSE